jgi:hypothetical protein
MSFGFLTNNDMNFKFTSKFALIHANIISLQIQILLC